MAAGTGTVEREASQPEPDERSEETASEPDVYAWVLDTVADTLGGHDKPLWSSRTQVLAQAVKTTNSYDKAAAKRAINQAIDNDDLFLWHGLLAPADPEHLRKIIEAEREATITRKLMVGKINKLLGRLNGGDGRAE